MNRILKCFLHSLTFLLGYELAIIILWLFGLDSFAGIHYRAWAMDLVPALIGLTLANFMYRLWTKE